MVLAEYKLLLPTNFLVVKLRSMVLHVTYTRARVHVYAISTVANMHPYILGAALFMFAWVCIEHAGSAIGTSRD